MGGMKGAPISTGPPQGQPLPPEYGPPPYEGLHPGFLPPHVPGDGPMPMPMPMQMPPPTQAGIYPPPCGHFTHPLPGHMGPVGRGPFVHMGGHTATTIMAPPGSATTVLQGEMCQTSPVQTACPHCQQAIVTRISHDVGLMNTLFCLFCFFVG